jgi:protein gp37
VGAQTNIHWSDSTWNFWIGCSKVSTHCANCYADELDEKRFSKTLGGATKENPVRHWGKGAPRHLTSEATRNAPLVWNKRPLICANCGFPHTKAIMICKCGSIEFYRRRVFTGSLMDWADEEVPDSWRDELFTTAEQCQNLTFQFLTKRPYHAHRYLANRYGGAIPRHFWIGMSWMDDKPNEIEWLLRIPAAIRFLSVEPMLGPLTYQLPHRDASGPSIDWLILGGESGNNARPCNVKWIRDGMRQCRESGVVPFVKQMGSFCIEERGSQRVRIHHDDRAGADPLEWPEALRIQEFPQHP